MLLTTSRKPSQRTRSFSQRLSRIMGWRYVNRGKMSIRDVLIEASGPVALVSERHGNPSRITFLGERGDERGYILFNPSFDIRGSERDSPAAGTRSCPPELKDICRLIGLEVDPEASGSVWDLREGDDYPWVMELFDATGKPAGFKLLIRDFKAGE
ncbi:Brix domain-containing protein [Methanothermobacter marburgensis]|uniref:Brix domain-containing protein n=1 Tax=Methanothermobacter marburgensis TaxID=145263 RepID=UPI0035BB0ADF